jgi:hypothetical protein
MATRGEFAGLDVDFSSDSGGLASTTLLRALLSYFALKNSGRDCRRPGRDDGLDLLG